MICSANFTQTALQEIRRVRLGAVGVPHAGSDQNIRVHQARVDAHHLDPGIHSNPMRDAPALTTAVGLEDLIALHVDVGI